MSLIINKNIRILNQSNLPILILILQPSLCVVDPHHVCPEKHNEVLVYIITPLKHAEMGQNWPGSGSVWHESGQNQASTDTVSLAHVLEGEHALVASIRGGWGERQI